MGSALEIGIKFRKIVVISIRGCYRSVFNHPFLVAFLGFLFLLYRSFPFLFSVLVSASPVLVCTAVLLGTLLSFGQPNVPEIEREEEKVTHGISSFQTGFSEGHTVVAARDESYFVKGYSENRSDDIEDSGLEEASLLGERDTNNNKWNEEDCGLLADAPQEEEENFRGIQHEKEVNEGGGSGFCSFELGKRREVEENLRSEVVSSDDEAIEKQYVMVEKEIDDDILDSKNEEEILGDHAEFLASSSWKQVEDNNGDEEDEDDGDESVESGSDQAESSSPDASMADIIPILDELHPLLDLDAPQPAHLSRDAYDAASESSHKSDGDSVESDEYAEHGEGEEDGIDEHDDEEEEETEGGKEDDSKSAIKWTEDDQKNLMDLGTLELERNQRLENLIARRRARRMMNEKNLIDLDFSDIPSNVAPIATTRRNPFDFPDESDAAMGLPPIPGSAPSILQPRRNPFDIPYDSNEEKPDLKGDSFQQEFSVFNQKEAFFRRHESFSLGPSVLGISKHERHDMNWKPIFVSERMASEGTSYSSFQRQSSEVSESKLSSVPDTESVSSIDQDERKFSEQDLSREADIISNIDHVSDAGEHRSQSSGENDSVEMVQVEESTVRHDEAEIVLGGVENPSEMESYPETGEVQIPEQFDSGETQLRGEPNDEESSSSRSSHSSLSEVIDSIPDEKMEKEANLQQEDGHLEESRISTQTSGEESNFQHVSSEVEDNQHVEPVYDSSPLAAEKLQSFPSVSSDSATEFSERVLTPSSVEITASLADNESDAHDQRLEENSSVREETHATSSKLHMEVKNELRSEKSEDISQHNVPPDEISEFAPNFVDQSGPTMGEIRDVPVSEDSNLSSDIGSVKGVTDSVSVHGQDLADHDSEIHLQDNVDSPDSNYQMASETSYLSDDKSVEECAVPDKVSRFDHANMSESVQDAEEMLGSVGSDSHSSSNDLSMHAARDLQLPVEAEQAPAVHPNLPSEDEILLSRSTELGNTDIHQDLDQNMVTFTSDSQHEIDVKSPSSLESCLSSSDKLVVAPSSSDRDENQTSDVIQVETAEVIGTSNNGDGELHDAEYETPLNVSSVTSEVSETPEFGSPTGEVDLEVNRRGVEVENEDRNEAVEHLDASDESYTSQVTEESVKEFDDMKEIHEGFLSELDTVGDFSVNDAGVLLHTDNIPEKVAEAEREAIPVLEARSLEDINSAFKQLQEGVDVQEVILPCTIEDQLVSEESKDHHPEVDSDLKVVEARYLEDIDVALKQILEGDQGEPSKPSDLSDRVKTEVDEVGSAKVDESIDVAGSDLKVVEARSVEDIDIALKQISEDNQGEPSKPWDLSDGSLKTEVDEIGLAKVDESIDVADSDLKVVEARSQEDIDITLKQIPEGIQGEPSKPSNLNNGSVKWEVDEGGSAKVAESIDVATSTEEVSKTPEEKLEIAPVKSSGD